MEVCARLLTPSIVNHGPIICHLTDVLVCPVSSEVLLGLLSQAYSFLQTENCCKRTILSEVSASVTLNSI